MRLLSAAQLGLFQYKEMTRKRQILPAINHSKASHAFIYLFKNHISIYIYILEKYIRRYTKIRKNFLNDSDIIRAV